MASSARIFDVFISHSAADVQLAEEISNLCMVNGLTAFRATESVARRGEDWVDVLWEALSESRAVIAILPPFGPTPSMAVEIGAARAWNKPLFGVLTDPTQKPKPISLEGMHFYTASRIEDVITAIKLSREAFSDDDRAVLANLYANSHVNVDQLALDPINLQRLVKRFARSTGKIVSGEQLLSELLRLRKQGKLSRHVGSRRARRPTGTD